MRIHADPDPQPCSILSSFSFSNNFYNPIVCFFCKKKSIIFDHLLVLVIFVKNVARAMAGAGAGSGSKFW